MKPAIWGAMFGVVALTVGVFAGLQVSVLLGNLLAFPLIVVSLVSATPIGAMGIELLAGGLALSMAIWAAIFVGVSKIVSRD